MGYLMMLKSPVKIIVDFGLPSRTFEAINAASSVMEVFRMWREISMHSGA